MSERKIEIPEFLKKKPRETINTEKTELEILRDSYREMFGDCDYTNIFMSKAEQIAVLKECLKRHVRFDDLTGVTDMMNDDEYI